MKSNFRMLLLRALGTSTIVLFGNMFIIRHVDYNILTETN